MSLSRRDLRELEKTIAGITTENLRAMVGRDRAKHIREVLAAAERELTKRGVEFGNAPRGAETIQQVENQPQKGTDDDPRAIVSGGVFLGD